MSGVTEVGRVVVEAEVESAEDLYRVARGEISPGEIRRVHLKDAIVDAGATTLCLTASMIQQLGLIKFGEKTFIYVVLT